MTEETMPRRPGRPVGAVARPKGERRKQPLPPKKTPDRKGRVTYVRYTKAVAQEICERLAQGEVWFRICNSGNMPAYTTLYDWLKKHPDFAEAYAQAREMVADMRADKALVVAEEATAASVQADRLHVNTLQWHAAKAAPKKYGARAEAPEAGEAPRLIIEVRRFERAVRPDGTAYVREIAPDGAGKPHGGKPQGGKR